MPEKNLTLRQVEIVIAIRNHKHLHGYSPTIRELAAIMNLARGTIVQHIESLEKKAVLRRTPRISRSLEILQAA
jgi:repressor LexA